MLRREIDTTTFAAGSIGGQNVQCSEWGRELFKRLSSVAVSSGEFDG